MTDKEYLDQCAIQAMNAYITRSEIVPDVRIIKHLAYEQAKAMLEERKKGTGFTF